MGTKSSTIGDQYDSSTTTDRREGKIIGPVMMNDLNPAPVLTDLKHYFVNRNKKNSLIYEIHFKIKCDADRL